MRGQAKGKIDAAAQIPAPRETGLNPDGTVARAFDLAKSGTCHTITEIRQQLKVEGYSQIEAHLEGRAVKQQLKALMQGGHVACPDSDRIKIKPRFNTCR